MKNNNKEYKSPFLNCYVYELSEAKTGEIFFVGYSSDEQFADAWMDPDYLLNRNAHRIMDSVENKKTILATGLTEDEAKEIVDAEIERIQNETDYLLVDEGNQCLKEDEFSFGRAPVHSVTPAEKHYLHWDPVPFDNVDIAYLKVVYIDSGFLACGIERALYGDRYTEKYYELKKKLECLGVTVIATKYAKSVTAWIYTGGSMYSEYLSAQKRAVEKIGRNIPTYHMIDVLNAFQNISSHDEKKEEDIEICPVNNRCPWREVENLGNSKAGFEQGYPLWEKGEKLRKEGKLEAAIALFDQSRAKGYDAPVLFNSYCVAYRKLKDYENEIDILEEMMDRGMSASGGAYGSWCITIEEKIKKAKQKLLKMRQGRGI